MPLNNISQLCKVYAIAWLQIHIVFYCSQTFLTFQPEVTERGLFLWLCKYHTCLLLTKPFLKWEDFFVLFSIFVESSSTDCKLLSRKRSWKSLWTLNTLLIYICTNRTLRDCCQTQQKLWTFLCLTLLVVHKLDLVPSKLLPECINMYR